MKVSKTRKIGSVIVKGIELAEDIFGSGNGDQKKEFVVDMLVSKIDIPLIGTSLEKKLFGVIVDIVHSLWDRYVNGK